MKKLLLYLALFANLSSYGQNVTGKIVYDKTLNFDRLITKVKKDSNSNDKTTSLLKEIKGLSENTEYELLFKDVESNYSAIKKIESDTKKKVLSNLNIAKFKGNFYFNSRDKTSIHNYNFSGELLRVVDSTTNSFNLTKDTKKIGDYTCFKAIFNKKYKKLNGEEVTKEIICWYTPDIPVPFGPEKFNSLPGLILEVITDREHILVKKIEVNPKDIDIKIRKPTKGKEISPEEIDDFARNELKKRMDAMKIKN